MPFNERSVQLGIFELHIHFDEDINYEGNISGGNSSLLPPENLTSVSPCAGTTSSRGGQTMAPFPMTMAAPMALVAETTLTKRAVF